MGGASVPPHFRGGYMAEKKRNPIPQSVRFNVFRRDDFTCRYCGRSSPEVTLHCDHAKSVKDGGDDTEENLVTSCSDCNYGKSSKTVIREAPLKVAAHDGLVGMWGHTFDADKNIAWQFKIIRKINDALYVCQLFSWLDGGPTNCETIHTDKLTGNDCKLYATNEQMREAADWIMDRQYQDRRTAREIEAIMRRG